jgi:hypothetical protein
MQLPNKLGFQSISAPIIKNATNTLAPSPCADPAPFPQHPPIDPSPKAWDASHATKKIKVGIAYTHTHARPPTHLHLLVPSSHPFRTKQDKKSNRRKQTHETKLMLLGAKKCHLAYSMPSPVVGISQFWIGAPAEG